MVQKSEDFALEWDIIIGKLLVHSLGNETYIAAYGVEKTEDSRIQRHTQPKKVILIESTHSFFW